jgi:hypothetical protein
MWDNTIDIGHCSRLGFWESLVEFRDASACIWHAQCFRLGFWESSVEFRVLEDRIGIKNDCKIIRVIEYDVDIYKYD